MITSVWSTTFFSELSALNIHQILRLRSDVFVVEQECIFSDPDSYDLSSYHIMGVVGSQLVATARIIPPMIQYHDVSIGRVAVALSHRRKGFGKEVMRHAIQECIRLYPDTNIHLSAQTYLLEFYSSFGFVACGDDYLEDGIVHRSMIRYR